MVPKADEGCLAHGCLTAAAGGGFSVPCAGCAPQPGHVWSGTVSGHPHSLLRCRHRSEQPTAWKRHLILPLWLVWASPFPMGYGNYLPDSGDRPPRPVPGTPAEPLCDLWLESGQRHHPSTPSLNLWSPRLERPAEHSPALAAWGWGKLATGGGGSSSTRAGLLCSLYSGL